MNFGTKIVSNALPVIVVWVKLVLLFIREQIYFFARETTSGEKLELSVE